MDRKLSFESSLPKGIYVYVVCGLAGYPTAIPDNPLFRT